MRGAARRPDELLPARLTWLIIAALAAVLPGYSARKAWTSACASMQLLLGPNAGWSEAAAAGALERQIVGPIWLNGVQVTDLWIGEPSDPPLATAADVTRAMALVVLSGSSAAAGAPCSCGGTRAAPACCLRPRVLIGKCLRAARTHSHPESDALRSSDARHPRRQTRTMH